MTDQRVEGYLRAHAEAGVKPPAGHVVRARSVSRAAATRCRRGCSITAGGRCPRPFGCNDAIAFGCVEALRSRGLRVPDDVSVVGYDHTFMARFMHMATVHQPLHEMGRRAVEALHRGEPNAGPSTVVLPTRIVSGVTLAGPRWTRLPIA